MPEKENKLGQWGTIRYLFKSLFLSDLSWIKLRVFISILFLFIGKLVNVYVPFLYKDAVDALSESVPTSKTLIFWIIFSYAAARVGSSIFLEVKDYIFQYVSRRAQRQISVKVFEKLHRLSMAFHLTRKTGSVTRYIELGARGIDFVLGFVLFNILPTIIEIFLVTFILFYKYNIQFAFITFATILTYIFTTLLLTEWRMKHRRVMNESDSLANAKAVDSLLNFETVKYFGNEESETRRYDDFLKKYERAGIQTQGSLSILNVLQGLVISVGLLSVMYLSGKGVLDGKYTVGDFVLVNTFLIQLYLPLNFLGFVYRQVKNSLVDMERMFSLMFENEEIQDRENAKVLKVESNSSVVFENVDFSYAAERKILKGISFEVPSGNTVAIVGESGSGKSTITRLLFRFYEVGAGKVLIGGEDISKVTLSSLRSSIGVVPQDTVLFNETIGYNIQYGDLKASKESVVQAAKAANIFDFIQKLPKGLETVVGERGLKLSGGEKQRVAIARTILNDPKVLIMDEATSALDSQTEKKIQDELLHLSEDRTTLVIAHRLSTITHADEIIVLDEGVIRERGSHQSLLDLKGLYFKMWVQQSEESKK